MLFLAFSKLIAAEKAYAAALNARVNAIDEVSLNADTELDSIAAELSWLEHTREQFLPIVEQYERYSPIIRQHIIAAKASILPRAKSQFEAALDAFKIKLDELEIRAKKEGMIDGEEPLDIKNFPKDSDIAGYLAAKAVYDTMEATGGNFFATPQKMTLKDFNDECRTAIREARPVLSLHRGWGEILGKLGFMLTVCLSGGTALIASKVMTGNWTFFNHKTDAEDCLDDLRSSFMALTA